MRPLGGSGSGRRPLAWIAVVLMVVLGVLAVGSVLHHEVGAARTSGAAQVTSSPSDAAQPGVPTSPNPAPGSAIEAKGLEPIPQTSDPTTFARAASEALFEWDTTSGFSVGEYRGRLLVVADPTGEESPGFVSDLAAYLPDAETWDHLSRYSTRQWLQVTEVTVPGQWYEALAQAAAGTVAEGTTAVTVTGVRHRAGVWREEAVTSTHDVAFTLFVVCVPTHPTCHLLRISQLDNPLR